MVKFTKRYVLTVNGCHMAFDSDFGIARKLCAWVGINYDIALSNGNKDFSRKLARNAMEYALRAYQEMNTDLDVTIHQSGYLTKSGEHSVPKQIMEIWHRAAARK